MEGDAKILEIEEMIRSDLGFDAVDSTWLPFPKEALLPMHSFDDDDDDDDDLRFDQVPEGSRLLLAGEPLSQMEVKSQAEHSGVQSGQVHFQCDGDEKPLVRQNSDPFPRVSELGSLRSEVSVLKRQLDHVKIINQTYKNKARALVENVEKQLMAQHDVDSPPVLTPAEVTTSELVKKYGSLKNAARVKSGCLDLQKVIESTTPGHIQSIANQLLPSMVSLANDFFGNYVVQCLIKAATDDRVIKDLCEALSGELGALSKTQTGTRVAQALLLKCRSSSHWRAVSKGLACCITDLAMDGVGTYVMQKAVEVMPQEHVRHLYKGLHGHIKMLAEDRNGACGVRTCMKYSKGAERRRLIEELAVNARMLAMHGFGNYVVQAALDGPAEGLVMALTPHIVELAKDKQGSNVVELLLKKPAEPERRAVMSVVIAHSQALSIDVFGNFVVQTAVSMASPQEFAALSATLQPAFPHLAQFKQGRSLLQLLRSKVPKHP